MNGVRPFEPTQVGPGLCMGFSSGGDASSGYNRGLVCRDVWRDPTVDELRVATNPKASEYVISGYETAGKAIQTNLGLMSSVQKNRPDRVADLGNEDYSFTNVGAACGVPTLPPSLIDRPTARQSLTAEYAGIAQGPLENVGPQGEIQPSSRRLLDEPLPPINSTAPVHQGSAQRGDYGRLSCHSYENNRTSNPQPNLVLDFGMVTRRIAESIAPFLDLAKPTRKDLDFSNLRPFANACSSVPAPTTDYLYDPRSDPQKELRPTLHDALLRIAPDQMYLTQVDRNNYGAVLEARAMQQGLVQQNQVPLEDRPYVGGGMRALGVQASGGEIFPTTAGLIKNSVMTQSADMRAGSIAVFDCLPQTGAAAARFVDDSTSSSSMSDLQPDRIISEISSFNSSSSSYTRNNGNGRVGSTDNSSRFASSDLVDALSTNPYVATFKL